MTTPNPGTIVEYYLQYESDEGGGLTGLIGVPFNEDNDATARAACIEIVGRHTNISVVAFTRLRQDPNEATGTINEELPIPTFGN